LDAPWGKFSNDGDTLVLTRVIDMELRGRSCAFGARPESRRFAAMEPKGENKPWKSLDLTSRTSLVKVIDGLFVTV
jgi:hypothetical protein